MANSLNSLPIIVDTDFVSWRNTQTLNTGNLPATVQQPGPIRRQFGLKIAKLVLMTNGATTAGTISITDPIDSTILETFNVTTTAPAGIITTQDWADNMPLWRDFSVTGVTATGTKLLIWYRA